jgi:tRNA pseudouridine38-40 synthase
MPRYFLRLSFKGTAYHGWQAQPNATTVQKTVESALQILTGETTATTGAGRTDTGVHARYFILHTDTNHPLYGDRPTLLYKLNSLLPEDIAVHDVYAVKPDVHARFSALSRTYEYRISRMKDPFDTEFAWYFGRPLDIGAMNLAASVLLDQHDFTSFSKLHSDTGTNICRVNQAAWFEEGDKLIFRICADRFLRNMVRALVGTLIEVGLGRTGQDGFLRVIEGRDRGLAGFSVPARGLTLTDITYPEEISL